MVALFDPEPDRFHRCAAVDAVADELARRLPAHSLPGRFYWDDAVYRRELERIWYREWVFVAPAAAVGESGAWLTVRIGDYSIVVIRGRDGVVRAFHNVCRHRGSLVCIEAAGVAKHRLVCPYHQWSYDLRGTLVGLRGAAAGFDHSTHGLVPVACEVTGGLIFVSLADEPPDFEPMRQLTDDYLAPFDLDRARVAATVTTVEAGNWKLVMENNRECHHCASSHPELCTTFPQAPLHSGGGEADDAAAVAALVERGEALGLPSRFLASADNQFRAMRMPFVGDARSMTPDGTPAVGRRFGSLPEENIGDVLLYHYPSTWNHFMADHAVTFRIVPMGPTSTALTTTWLVPEGAEEGVDYDLDVLTSVWRATNDQDTALVERTQVGVMSPAYRPGPYAPVDELGVIQFVDWYDARMRAEHNPT